ncbi:MAG: hypothetical protein K0S41_2060 [Anaerocolumna sp.]|jgi:hypothetical protein|nr:hypothetical protein [Anaerocolumna sp.]
MAYTAEQREAKRLEEEGKLKAELEAKIRKELEAEYKARSKAETKENVKVDLPVKNVKKKIPLDTMIPCRSGVQGKLVYVSTRINGYRVDWEDYGSIEYIELSELISMRNTGKSFYVNNWVFFEDTDEYTATDVYNFLEVSKYYENAIVGEDLDKIFTMTPEEIIKLVSKLSRGVKDNIAAKARILIDNKEFDSGNRIDALQKALDVELRPSY